MIDGVSVKDENKATLKDAKQASNNSHTKKNSEETAQTEQTVDEIVDDSRNDLLNDILTNNAQAVCTSSINGIFLLSKLTKDRKIKLFTMGNSSKKVAQDLGFKNIIDCNGDSDRRLISPLSVRALPRWALEERHRNI